MNVHKNARLSQHSRAEVVRRVIERMPCRIKELRRVATPCGQRADHFLSAVLLAVAKP